MTVTKSERFRLSGLVTLKTGERYKVHDGGGWFEGEFSGVEVRNGFINLVFLRQLEDGETAQVLIPGSWNISVKLIEKPNE